MIISGLFPPVHSKTKKALKRQPSRKMIPTPLRIDVASQADSAKILIEEPHGDMGSDRGILSKAISVLYKPEDRRGTPMQKVCS